VSRPDKCWKVPFASQRDASRELTRLLRKRAIQAAMKQIRPMECRAYECPNCQQWHLTSSAWAAS
jgi:hypothetical protein